MMVNSAQPGEGGGARLPPDPQSNITSTFGVYAPAERPDTLLPFLLYPCLLFGVLYIIEGLV
jgi:hypothetical protein